MDQLDRYIAVAVEIGFVEPVSATIAAIQSGADYYDILVRFKRAYVNKHGAKAMADKWEGLRKLEEELTQINRGCVMLCVQAKKLIKK